MDIYRAVTLKRFDCRMDRPSLDVIVFCRETGVNEVEEEVEVLDGLCSIVATDIAIVKSGKGAAEMDRLWCGISGYMYASLMRLGLGGKRGRRSFVTGCCQSIPGRW